MLAIHPYFNGGQAYYVETSDPAVCRALVRLLRGATPRDDHKRMDVGAITIRYDQDRQDQIRILPGHDPGWYLLHARKAWRPSGEGLRELAEASD